MRIALLGPVVKDKITVDRATTVQVGGIPYYAGVALKNLGADVTVFATYYSEDDAWVRKNFKYIELFGHMDPLHLIIHFLNSEPSIIMQ